MLATLFSFSSLLSLLVYGILLYFWQFFRISRVGIPFEQTPSSCIVVPILLTTQRLATLAFSLDICEPDSFQKNSSRHHRISKKRKLPKRPSGEAWWIALFRPMTMITGVSNGSTCLRPSCHSRCLETKALGRLGVKSKSGTTGHFATPLFLIINIIISC